MALIERTFTPGQKITLTKNRVVVADEVLAAGDDVTLVGPGDDIHWAAAGGPAPTPTPTPTPVPAPPPPPTPGPDGRAVWRINNDSLQTVLNGAKNVIIELSPDVMQTIRGVARVGDNVTIRCADPNRRARVHIPAGPGQYWGLRADGRGTQIHDLHFYTNYGGTDRKGCPARAVTFGGGGSGEVRNCFGDRLDVLIQCEQDHTGVRVIRCETTDRTRGQAIWGGGPGVHIEECTLRSSNEHPIRFGDDDLEPYKASNVVIRLCKLFRGANSVKECLSIRKGAGPFLVEDTLCQVGDVGGQVAVGYGVRLGYEKGYKTNKGVPVGKLGRITIRNMNLVNCWLDAKPGNIAGPLVFEHVHFSGDLKVKPPMQLHGLPATQVDVTW